MSETKAEEEESWPPHDREWQSFLQELREQDQFHSWFGPLSPAEARRIWSLLEKEFFARYQFFVRLWPEWCSTGLWQAPYPGSRSVGYNLDPTAHLGLSAVLRERLKRWQEVYDTHGPWASETLDWRSFNEEAERLARALKGELGELIYVEYHELQEVLRDGSVRDWRPLLGLPPAPSPGEAGAECR